MHSCLSAVKTSMLVVQRSQDALSLALQVPQDEGELEDTLGRLLGCYIHILTDGEKPAKFKCITNHVNFTFVEQGVLY